MSKLLDYDGLGHFKQKYDEKVASIRLGKAQDGYIYIFVGGEPQGYGFDPETGDIIIPVIYGDVVSSPDSVSIPSLGTATMYVKLSRQPSASQTVSVSSRSESLTVSANTLTFTESTWDVWQTVTLTSLYNDLGDINTTVVLENSDPLITESAVSVTLKGISYESLVDTTIPSGAHTITTSDFATVTSKAYGVILSGYNAQYTNIYVPEYVDYNGDQKKVILKGADSFKNNTTIQYVELAAGIGANEYATSATARDWIGLFGNCTNLIGVKYNGTDLTSLASAFAGCTNLTFFDGLERQTTSAINMDQAFYSCSSIEYVQDLSGLTISGMQASFRNCSSLVRILGYPTPTATNATNMFNGCSDLEYAVIPSSTANSTYMFNNCTSLRKVDCLRESEFTGGAASMFSGCSNLYVYCVADSDCYTQLIGQYGSSSTIHILTNEGGELPNIVVWGDSDSSPNKGWKEWPARLLEMVTGFNLKNQAVAGEFTTSTSARQGGNAVSVGAFTIPATTDKVAVTLTSQDGQTFGSSPVWSGGGDYNPCTISGIKGTLKTTSSVVYFTRATAGSETAVSANTIVTSDNDSIYNNEDAVMLINLGNNAGWNETPSTLLNQVNLMVQHFVAKGGTKYIISGPFASTYTRSASGINMIQQYEALAAAQFGNHWFSLRQYLIDYGLTQNNLTATESDTERMAAGQVPGSLLGGGTTSNILMYPTTSSDDAHVNAYGSNSVALAYYQKGVALGYWE